MALKNEFASTQDSKAYLGKVGSEIPFYDSYFSRSKMQMANKDSIIKTPIGVLIIESLLAICILDLLK